jgi:peptidoglycan/xylan/chitin deacetylase (PgdA/CDA1 family)
MEASIAHGVMFHHFHGGRHSRVQGSISEEDLEGILQFIGVQHTLTPAEWLEKLDTDRLDERDLCLTFDDGLLCQFEVALPLLERYRLKAFWFVYSSVFEGQIELGKLEIYRAFRCKFFPTIDDFYTGFFQKVFEAGFAKKTSEVVTEARIQQMTNVFPFYSVNDAKFRLVRDLVLGRQEYEGIMDEMIQEHGVDRDELSKDLWMSNAQLRYLNDQGHMVGLHSYSHPTTLAGLSYANQREEYQKNYQHILAVCGQAPMAMAHPANSYSKETIKILMELGIRCGFRSNMLPPHPGGQPNLSRYEMAREDDANILRMLGGSR